MMIMFIQHIQCSTFQNSTVQYWLATFNAVCDLLEVTKSTVPMCGCMLVILSDIYCQSTCCLFKLAEYSSNCSSFVSMVFPSFCRTYKQHNHTERPTSHYFRQELSDTILGRGTNVVTVWPQKYDSPIGSTFTLEIYISCSDCSLWWWVKSSIIMTYILKYTLKSIGSQWRALNMGVMWDLLLVLVKNRVATLCTTCKNKSCHCMATEIRLAKWFHVNSWNISSFCSL